MDLTGIHIIYSTHNSMYSTIYNITIYSTYNVAYMYTRVGHF